MMHDNTIKSGVLIPSSKIKIENKQNKQNKTKKMIIMLRFFIVFFIFIFIFYQATNKVKLNNNIINYVQGPARFTVQQPIICSTDDDCNDNDACTIVACDTETKKCIYSPNIFTKECGTFGNPTVLAIRTIAPDAQTTYSSDEISNSLFGTYGQSFTMISQFSDCSYDAFKPMPFSGITTTGVNISSVAEVNIATNVTGEPIGLIEDLILEKADQVFGDLQSQFDFVMIFVPPGTVLASTKDWKAYAYMDHWMSVYNDAWSIYPGVHMHEIGHNIGLSHSHDETSYGDGSCLMGASPEITNGPKKCFNGPKSWQLGWYHLTQLVRNVETITDDHEYYKLYGVSDYDEALLQNAFTAIKLTNTADNFDYYVTLNSKSGIAIDTEDGENSVLVSRRTVGSLNGDSFLLSRLKDKDRYIMNVRMDGSLFEIVVDLRRTYAKVRFYTYASCKTDNKCNDFDSCTIDKCNNKGKERGICTHSPIDCSSCGTIITLSATTNNYPNELFWKVDNIDTSRAIILSSASLVSNTFYSETKCLGYGNYIFSLSYTLNDTSSSNVSYTLKAENEVIDQYATNVFIEIEEMITVCSTDEDCFDYGGCSTNFCNDKTKLCENEELLGCLNCKTVLIQITPDNYPEETTWELKNSENEELILSGNPYPTFSLASGRKHPGARKNSGARKNYGARKHSGARKKSMRTSFLSSDNNPTYNDVVYEQICLVYDYTYTFLIKDSFGDGMCCVEGDGYYTISINNETIKKGGDFGKSEELSFKFKACSTDEDCDDEDSSTADTCQPKAETCLYIPQPCDKYGAMVVVNVTTDMRPEQTRWTISDEDDKVLTKGGPYQQNSYTYHHKQCLAYGVYNFAIYDDKGNGVSQGGVNSKEGEYIIYTQEETIKNGGGNFGILETISFEITRLSKKKRKKRKRHEKEKGNKQEKKKKGRKTKN